MHLKSLTLTNVRAFKHAEFTFQPGVNLIVGINGVGKSTVLDTIRIMLAQALPKLTVAQKSNLAFNINDITVEQEFLTTDLQFQSANIDFQYIVYHPREEYGYISESEEDLETDIEKLDRRRRIEERRLKKRGYTSGERQQLTSNPEKLPKNLKTADLQSLAVYFSTHRSLTSMKAPRKGSGQALAFMDTFSERELQPRAFAEWLLVQDALMPEDPQKSSRGHNILKQAVERFLPEFNNLRPIREPETTLLVDKADNTLDIRQLSDGERGILALIMDLARRLLQANPKLDDPLQAQAVVLIDELDLHLHPQWQRTIVSKLTTTFPNCQFIATTHSPLIIGEVEPENIILIAEDGEIIHPNQSLGMDTDWILKYIMGATTRHTETTLELKRIADLIENEDYDTATDAIDALRDQIGEFPELVRLQTRIDRFQLLGE
jgi:predicted ATP-binding protein involved in virulence